MRVLLCRQIALWTILSIQENCAVNCLRRNYENVKTTLVYILPRNVYVVDLNYSHLSYKLTKRYVDRTVDSNKKEWDNVEIHTMPSIKNRSLVRYDVLEIPPSEHAPYYVLEIWPSLPQPTSPTTEVLTTPTVEETSKTPRTFPSHFPKLKFTRKPKTFIKRQIIKPSNVPVTPATSRTLQIRFRWPTSKRFSPAEGWDHPAKNSNKDHYTHSDGHYYDLDLRRNIDYGLRIFSTFSAYVEWRPNFTALSKYFGTTKILRHFSLPEEDFIKIISQTIRPELYAYTYVLITVEQPLTNFTVLSCSDHSTTSPCCSRNRTINKKRRRKRYKRRSWSRQERSKCYTCGLNDTGIPAPSCDNAFETNPMFIKTSCHSSGRKLRRDGRKFYGPFMGGCFRRYLDVGVEYDERGCRTWPPMRGKSFASHRFARLEKILYDQAEGCVASPQASLVPFSRGVSLYARFHVCVCQGDYCNSAEIVCERLVIFGLLLIKVLR